MLSKLSRVFGSYSILETYCQAAVNQLDVLNVINFLKVRLTLYSILQVL